MAVESSQLIALNEQFSAWSALDRPRVSWLARGIDRGTLRAINESVRRLESEGLGLSALVDRDKGEWAPEYFQLVDLGLRCHDLSAPLARLVEFYRGIEKVRSRAAVAMAYPLMVSGLAIAVLAWICVRTVPSLDHAARALQAAEGNWIPFMLQLRAWMPVWLPTSLGGLLFIWLWYVMLRRGGGVLQSRLAASTGWRSDLQWAQIAELSSILVANATEAEQAVGLTRRVIRGGESRRQASAGELPPMLSWALAGSGEPAEKAARLHTAAVMYRDLAEGRADRLSRRLPAVMCVAMGGVATLVAGVSLFAPFSELMRNIP